MSFAAFRFDRNKLLGMYSIMPENLKLDLKVEEPSDLLVFLDEYMFEPYPVDKYPLEAIKEFDLNYLRKCISPAGHK